LAAPPPGIDLTGIWTCNDGGVYYIRQLDDGTVAWTGLDARMPPPEESPDTAGPDPDALIDDLGIEDDPSPHLFYQGIGFANVFQGSFTSDGAFVAGAWADVPRGATENHGRLTFAIFEDRWQNVTLERLDEETTGGFGGSRWTKNGEPPLTPQDISAATHSVYRYGDDGMLGENNPPCRDFTVIWGEVTIPYAPSLPPGGNSYCAFIDDWDGDGDISFSFWPKFGKAEFPFGTDENDFWATGWLTTPPDEFDDLPVDHIWNQFQQHKYFHAEIGMFGRANPEAFCDEPADVRLPGWNETGGNSVLVNGIPLEGHYRVDDNVSPLLIIFNKRPDGVEDELLLASGQLVRVSGVVADDHGHEGENAPEIHPVYAIDIVQDFSLPRRYPVLSGAWHASDNGTYYLRQLGDTVWWLGLSRDQGRTYANVFRGEIREGGFVGNWIDVPTTANPTLTQGELVITGDETASQITKTFETPRDGSPAGLGASWWHKLYDTPGEPAGIIIGPAIGAALD
jgi:hypothetical protein